MSIILYAPTVIIFLLWLNKSAKRLEHIVLIVVLFCVSLVVEFLLTLIFFNAYLDGLINLLTTLVFATLFSFLSIILIFIQRKKLSQPPKMGHYLLLSLPFLISVLALYSILHGTYKIGG